MESARQFGPQVFCPACKNARLPEIGIIANEYFCGLRTPCELCGCKESWWTTVAAIVRDNFMGGIMAHGLIGAQLTVVIADIVASRVVTVDFANHGVPPDAKIVWMNYVGHGDGGVSPMQFSANQPSRGALSLQFPVMGVSFRDGATHGQGQISAMWVPAATDPTPFRNLVEAFDAYGQGQHDRSVVPANTAVEAVVYRFMSDFLVRNAGIPEKRVKPFLEEDATYGSQLNVLLRVVATSSGSPILTDEVRGALNRLRDLRNDLVHRGHVSTDQQEVGTCLTAALFGMKYIQILHDRLLGA